ncbi:hypothetical protein [Roseateles amylovorans]|uniref:Uncharacterized protein n=1 Tax=Roseateles amylovorans TaxID=2978473 RepID=A0ABY6AW28_9BURK|nr:hypothetical protein [Roseateles amylovorans]UXH77077.1 hypothetical protein N4261_18930 [Roseateles amylovorans]
MTRPTVFSPLLSPTLRSALGVLSLLGALAASPARAQAPADVQVQAQEEAKEAQSKAARAAERARVEKYYRDKLAECHARFASTGCDEDLRAERIQALRPLQKADQEANARDRQRRAQAQRARVEEKDRQAAADEGRRKTESVRAADQPASAAALPPARAPRANPQFHQRQVDREAEAAKRKAAARREAAEVRRQQAEENARQAEALQKKRAAKPVDPKRPAPAHLPTPSASDIQGLPPR